MKKIFLKSISLTMALLMLFSLSAMAATEVVVNLTNWKEAKNPGFEEKSGTWFGSDNKASGIHYVDPETGLAHGRMSNSLKNATATVTAQLPEAGKYEVYYFVSGHNSDAKEMSATVNYKGGSKEIKFALNDASKKGFQKLGEFDFEKGEATVDLKVEAKQGYLRFSAIKFVSASGATSTVTPAPTVAPAVAPTAAPSSTGASVTAGSVVTFVADMENKNSAIEEVKGKWFGSDNKTLKIHYSDPATGKSLGRYSTNDEAEIKVTTKISTAGTYEVYYFVSGHKQDAAEVTGQISHKDGVAEVKFALNDAGEKGFQKLGEFEFAAGDAYATFTTQKGQCRFSAIKYVDKNSAPTPTTAPTVAPTPAGPTAEPSTKNSLIEGSSIITYIGSKDGANAGITESGKFFGSDNKTLKIHYENPVTGKTLGKYSSVGTAELKITTKIPVAGTYEVYYFVSGHKSDSEEVNGLIEHKNGTEEVKFALNDETKKGFYKLGEFDFDEGDTVASFKTEKNQIRFSALKYTIKDGVELPMPTPKPIATPTPTENPYEDKFEDLQVHWAKKTIEAMANEGVVKGTSETTFEPEGAVTRAEFTALMVRAMKYDAVPYEGQFEDVSADAWYAENVSSMAKTGIIVGYDGKFNPDNNINHQEAVKILVAAYELKFGELDPAALATIFKDYYEIEDWAKLYIHKGVMLSVAQGFEDELAFKPLQKTTRAEAATMIFNLMKAIKTSEKF